MKDNNLKQLLRDAEQIPNDNLFKEILSTELLQTYYEMLKILSDAKLSIEWRYYKDGKSWLCKVTDKKKTIVWISLWEGLFKSSFYFTEKHRDGIVHLAIHPDIKATFLQTKPIGKLIPIVLDLGNVSALDNLTKLIDYKLLCK